MFDTLSRPDVASLRCQLEYMGALLETLVGVQGEFSAPHDPTAQPFVKEGTISPGEASEEWNLEEKLRGKFASVSTVANLGDNPLTARFELAKRGYVNLTIMPRERFTVPFVYRSLQILGKDNTGASAYRVIAQ